MDLLINSCRWASISPSCCVSISWREQPARVFRTNNLLADRQPQVPQRTRAARSGQLRYGFEHLGPPKDMARIEPKDQVAIVGLGQLLLQLGYPAVGVHLNSVE